MKGSLEMLGTIILWVVAIFTAFWTFNWIMFHKRSRGHFWAITEVILLWILVLYFFWHPTMSRFHLLWAAPVTYVLGFLLSLVFFGRARRPKAGTSVMPEMTKHLGSAINDEQAGRITKVELLSIFQQAIDNGDAVSAENELYLVCCLWPLIDAGILRQSEHTRAFKKRMNEKASKMAAEGRARQRREVLADRQEQCKAELERLEAQRAILGEDAYHEQRDKLLGEIDEIEFTLGEDWLKRQDAGKSEG